MPSTLPEPSALPEAAAPPRWRLALVLFGLTFFTTTTLGPAFFFLTRTDVVSDLLPALWPPSLIARVWGDPRLLALGLSFSVPVLTILLCHEMGHYLACRYYRLPSTLPYFLPLPLALGTLGAFIRIRAPLRDKRQLFDVGAAGPLAGFAALIPFLLYGAAHSTVVLRPLRPGELLYVPGRSLALDLALRLFHGPIPRGALIDYHPFALAAWFGLLATAINLLPIGQLDGGHILYAAAGRWQRRLAIPVLALLALAGSLWAGWYVWCVLVLVVGLFHPRLSDESVPLGRGRQILAAVCLLILVLSFAPRGLREEIGHGAVLPPRAEPSEPSESPAGEWVELLQKSATSVTGPSLTNATSM